MVTTFPNTPCLSPNLKTHFVPFYLSWWLVLPWLRVRRFPSLQTSSGSFIHMLVGLTRTAFCFLDVDLIPRGIWTVTIFDGPDKAEIIFLSWLLEFPWHSIEFGIHRCNELKHIAGNVAQIRHKCHVGKIWPFLFGRFPVSLHSNTILGECTSSTLVFSSLSHCVPASVLKANINNISQSVWRKVALLL